MVNGYAWSMTHYSLVGKPTNSEDIYNLTMKPNKLPAGFIKPGVTAHEMPPVKSLKADFAVSNQPPSRCGTSVWMSTNFYLSWKETTWSSKKACASLLNLVSISLVKSAFCIEDCKG